MVSAWTERDGTGRRRGSPWHVSGSKSHERAYTYVGTTRVRFRMAAWLSEASMIYRCELESRAAQTDELGIKSGGDIELGLSTKEAGR